MSDFDRIMTTSINDLNSIIEEINANITLKEIIEVSSDTKLRSLIELAAFSVNENDVEMFTKVLQTIFMWGYYLGSQR